MNCISDSMSTLAFCNHLANYRSVQSSEPLADHPPPSLICQFILTTGWAESPFELSSSLQGDTETVVSYVARRAGKFQHEGRQILYIDQTTCPGSEVQQEISSVCPGISSSWNKWQSCDRSSRHLNFCSLLLFRENILPMAQDEKRLLCWQAFWSPKGNRKSFHHFR